MPLTVHGKPSAPILGSLLLAALIFALSQTVVAPALPAITAEFKTTTSAATWVLTGFLLTASISTPIAGKLGDLFGKARVMTVLLTVFALGSAVCALAPSVEVLIAGRLIMGIGGGVFPLAIGIINDEFPKQNRGVSIGLISAMFGIGGGIGLPLAGLIVDNVSVSWLFWIGLLALPAAVAVWRLVPPSPPRERTSIDWTGAALLSVGLAALLLGITKANSWGWGSLNFLALMIGGLIVIAVFGIVETQRRQPLVDMRVLTDRPVLATNLTAFLIGVAMFSAFLLFPLFAQTPKNAAGYGFSMSVTEAGLLMLPSSIAMFFAGPLAGVLGNRVGFRTILALGTVFSSLSFIVLTAAHGEPWHFAVANILIGVGIAFAFAATANLIVALVDPRDVGVATGINTISRTVGGAFGSALATALLTSETIMGTPIPTESAYKQAFLAAIGISLLALVSALVIPRHRRREGDGTPAAQIGERPQEAAEAI